jgi:8-oxo-dGTP pyrophosphatase MutT (NUDIX family)
MTELFQWLTNNPLVTTVLTISFVIFTFTFVFAVVQGREISIWPPKIGPKPVEVQRQSMLPSAESKLSKMFLFGYICIEKNGIETKVLVFNNQNFSPFIYGEILENSSSVELAIDKLILSTMESHGFTKNDLINAGFSKTNYQYLCKKENDKVFSTPYIFFKLTVQQEFSCSGCQWLYKNMITASLTDENQIFPLQSLYAEEIGKIFRKDYLTRQLDLVILECVDVLIFRENKDNQIEFLLIHRNRPDEAKVNTKDTWEYPKGGIRYYETYLEGVYREIQEETSIIPDELVLCSYLSWQTVDVSRRKKPYNSLRVHGYTLFYKGDADKKLYSGEGHDDFKWVSLEQAEQEIWMEENNYSKQFFRRWKGNEENILQTAGIKLP